MFTQWIENFGAAITVMDLEGNILDMNEAAAKVLENDGGKSLIGKNLMGCHQQRSRELRKKAERNLSIRHRGMTAMEKSQDSSRSQCSFPKKCLIIKGAEPILETLWQQLFFNYFCKKKVPATFIYKFIKRAAC